jgi:hypothetical protein
MNIIVVNVNTSRSMTEAIAWPLSLALGPRGPSVGAGSAHPGDHAGGQRGE